MLKITILTWTPSLIILDVYRSAPPIVFLLKSAVLDVVFIYLLAALLSMAAEAAAAAAISPLSIRRDLQKNNLVFTTSEYDYGVL